jgi:hypothetical protein
MRREDAVTLGRIIAASPELRERELVERAALADKIAAALRNRGTANPAAVVISTQIRKRLPDWSMPDQNGE